MKIISPLTGFKKISVSPKELFGAGSKVRFQGQIIFLRLQNISTLTHAIYS